MIKRLFNNPGKKIKILALTLFWLLGIAAIVGFIVLASIDDDLIGAAFGVLFGGIALAWASSIMLYGFGHLIENSDKIVTDRYERDPGFQSQPVDHNPEEQSYERQAPKTRKLQEKPVELIGKCELCDKENIPLVEAKIIDEMGSRYRKICKNCFDQSNAFYVK